MPSARRTTHLEGPSVASDHLDPADAQLSRGPALGGGLALDEREVWLEPSQTDTLTRTTHRGPDRSWRKAAPPRPKKRRRQWGAERPRPPLPVVEKPAGHDATWMGGVGLTVTVVAWLVYLAHTVISGFIDDGVHDSQFLAQTVAYVVLMTFLLYSSFMYLLARQGALYRSRDHVRVPRAEIDAFMATSQPSLTVLVPSYAEEPAVIRATLLSAALQEYPGLRIVLLLDDPPTPKDPAAAASLAGCRALPREIMTLLREPTSGSAPPLAPMRRRPGWAALRRPTPSGPWPATTSSPPGGSGTRSRSTPAAPTPTTSWPSRCWAGSRMTWRSPLGRSSGLWTPARLCLPSGWRSWAGAWCGPSRRRSRPSSARPTSTCRTTRTRR